MLNQTILALALLAEEVRVNPKVPINQFGDPHHSSQPATGKFQVSQASPKGVEPQRRPDRLGPDKVHPSVSAHESGVEICDVCGYVNREHAFVCVQCDVPLPSSVLSFRVRQAD